ncbi:hypothetical protein AVEN_73753-1 [Araneus ventricosus]|uniref:Uncharacterized protein n=1 Tax=Araneus ventricosus TaxID=182803 RepID=A0A4Y2XCX6_ARAVE|nr:hypothetical protein AVEN_73753-1 [Araneus ventricosus]
MGARHPRMHLLSQGEGGMPSEPFECRPRVIADRKAVEDTRHRQHSWYTPAEMAKQKSLYGDPGKCQVIYHSQIRGAQFQLHKILWVAVSSTVGLRVERRHHLIVIVR